MVSRSVLEPFLPRPTVLNNFEVKDRKIEVVKSGRYVTKQAHSIAVAGSIWDHT